MIGLAKQHHGLYHLDLNFLPQALPPQISLCSSSVDVPVQKQMNDSLLWHFRLGHMSNKMLRVAQHSDHTISVPSDNFCSICPIAKQKKLSFPLSKSRASFVFDLIHIDIWGPYRVPTLSGHQFFLTVVYRHMGSLSSSHLIKTSVFPHSCRCS